MYPCSTKTREVLGNPSLTPRRFPETREIPRVEFWWSTDILLIINQSTGMDQEIHPCEHSHEHSLILSREGLILTLSILPCPQGWISWPIPRDRIDDVKNVRTTPKLRISLGSRVIFWASGMDFPIPPLFWWSTDTIWRTIWLKNVLKPFRWHLYCV